MPRRIELICSAVGVLLAVLSVSYVYAALHGPVALGTPATLIDQPAIHRESVAFLLLSLGAAAGSYLHAVLSSRNGLVLLVTCTAGLVLGTALEVSGAGATANAWLYIYMVLPSWIPGAVGVAVVMPVFAAVSGLTPVLQRRNGMRISVPPGPESLAP